MSSTDADIPSNYDSQNDSDNPPYGHFSSSDGNIDELLLAAARACISPKARALTKRQLAKALVDEFMLPTSVASKALTTLAALAAREIKTVGEFKFPGLCRIKAYSKPATRACEKEIAGVMRECKAKPAKTIVKAFLAAVLKHSV